ncbi:MAG: ROK family transcriptional regulator [Spirochaetaceae bacterium]
MPQWNRHRQDNLIRVVETLWRQSGISRADVARLLRLDRSTVGSCVEHLMAEGIVAEGARGEGGPVGGRPPVLLSLRPEYGYSIGVELSGDTVVLLATNLAGDVVDHVVHRELIPTDGLTHRLVELIHDFRVRLADQGFSRLLSVAVGVSGMVDTAEGEILLSRTLGIPGPFPLGRALAGTLNAPVWVLNDADACAVGELEYGAGRNLGGDTSDILFVLVRYRVPEDLRHARLNAGLGVVLDGRLREAYSGGGREFRSPFVPVHSTEQFATAERSRRGEFTDARDLQAEFAEELGKSVAFLVHALDLRNVVLGGDLLLDTVDYAVFEERIRHHVISSTARVETQPLDLTQPYAGEIAVSFGASAAAVRRMFRNRAFPLHSEAHGLG